MLLRVLGLPGGLAIYPLGVPSPAPVPAIAPGLIMVLERPCIIFGDATGEALGDVPALLPVS